MVPTGAWWWWWWWWWCSTTLPPAMLPLRLTLSVLEVVLPLFHGWWLKGGEPGDGRPSLEDCEKQVPKSKSRLSCFAVWPFERGGGAGTDGGLS